MNGNVPRDADGRALTRADQFLLLIEQRCAAFEGAAWLPSLDGRGQYFSIGHESFVFWASGSGDASTLRSFERKGWIEWEPKLGKYACRITEDGRLHAQEIA
jgi:hypothetical protein